MKRMSYLQLHILISPTLKINLLVLPTHFYLGV